jgi:ribonuclease-3
MDLVHRGAVGSDRGRLLTSTDTAGWLQGLIGRAPLKPDLYAQALTHGSAGAADYERLEFLGDRVLGIVMAEWLYGLFPTEPEGALSRRLNALVSGETCAGIARMIEVQPHIHLGKQARDDGAIESDNILGDVMEALIGALFVETGIDEPRALIRRLWGDRVQTQDSAPRHPKSALQEWAAANRRKPPVYVMTGKTGPHHALRFAVTVSVSGAGEASAEGASKQEAETAAAKALLEKLS